MTDPNGNVTTAEYDEQNNLVKQNIPNKEIINHYDDYRKLLTTTKENDTTTIENTYDEWNQLIQKKNALSQVTKYEYNKYGELIKEDNEGYKDKVTNNSYDVLGRTLKQVQNDKVISDKQYDALGNVLVENENGLTKKYFYNKMNQVYQESYSDKEGKFEVIFTMTMMNSDS